MTSEEAVKSLDSLSCSDNETSHWEADRILLKFLEEHDQKGVAEAWKRASKRAEGFWYA